MSLILDALRRRSANRGGDDDAPESTARTDAVLATLGYPRPAGRRGLSMGALLLYSTIAVVVGFGGLSIIILLLAPSAPSAARPVARTAAATPRQTTPVPAARGTDAPPVGRVLPDPATAGPKGPALPSKPPPAPIASAPSPPARPLEARPVVPPTVAGSVPSTRPAETPFDAAQGRPQPSEPRLVAPRSIAVRRPPAPEPEPAPAVAAPPPAPPEDHFGLALYYQRVGDFDNALAHYRSLLERNDASAEVHNNLGLLYEERGQREDAIKQFQRAIAIDPKYVKAHNNLGVALMRSSQASAAAAEFRVALAADPRNVESLVNLALVQKAAGRVADARDLLRRALAIDPRSAGSHYNLAVVADEGGDASTAIEHYRAFLRFGAITNAELVGRVRARLTTLGG